MPDEGDWRLVYPGVDYTFGTPVWPVYFRTAPDLGDIEVRAEDGDRPRQDGRAFGQDFRGGRTITFDLGIWGSDESAARDAEAVLATAWRADVIRRTPGAVAELQIAHAGRQRAVFGRPRRYAAQHAHVKQGLSTAIADFAAVDDVFYDVAAEAAAIPFTSASEGGLLAPLAAPLTSSVNSDRSQGITVGGVLPAWPVIRIEGPITNPEVEIVGLWRLKLLTTLASDRYVDIDTRPWVRTVGGGLAGSITRDSVRLSNASIPPGSYEVVLRGTSPGGASVTLAWRPVYPSL